MPAVLDRNEIDKKYRWNQESVYQNDAAWEEDYEALKEEVATLSRYKGRLSEGAGGLLEWLNVSQDLDTRVWKNVVYANMMYSCNSLDQDAAAMIGRARGLMAKLNEARAFAAPELLELGIPTLRAWVAQEPGLAVYAHYVDRLERRAAHLRSAEVEALLGGLSDPFGAANMTHGVLANTDLDFGQAVGADGEAVDITQGTLGAHLRSTDRELRKDAWTKYADAHLKFKNTMAQSLSAGVKQDVFMARARNYDSSLEAALDPENLPVSVFHNLIDTFKKNLPTWHRYWNVRRRLLGVDALHEYDIFAPLTKNPPVIPYEQSVEWIADAMRPLGDEYVNVLRRGALEERWVDVYPNKGKRMGAFSSGISKATHPFIMMSYNDDIFSMSTLAHELGHSLHSYLGWQEQPQMYRYSLFVAEVASNFNQAMTRAYLFEQNSERDFQIAVIEEAMANFHRYFFIMPTLARFELEIHERTERGEALNATALNGLMADLFAEGYGSEIEMDRERVGITWAQFHTHLYSNFYVYQYATGISGAHALAKGVLDGKEGAAEKYLDFLRAGGSMYPLDALKMAGVDLGTARAVEETFAVLEGLVGRLEGFVE